VGGRAPETDLLPTGVAPLHAAGPGEVSFLDNRRYAAALAGTSAGAVIVHPDMLARVPPGTVPIATAEPYAGWARMAALFHTAPPVQPSVHPTAFVADGASVDPSVEVGPFAPVGAGAEVGARCRIGPHAAVGEGVVIGPDCRVGAHASLSHAVLGARVHVHPGARVGQEGFGFASAGPGSLSVPHLGRVVLGDDVEVGANPPSTGARPGTRRSGPGRGSITSSRSGTTSASAGAAWWWRRSVSRARRRSGTSCRWAGRRPLPGAPARRRGGEDRGAGRRDVGRARAGAEVVGSPAQPRHEVFRQIAVLRRMARQRV
jgi:UDP-3-O-[3-hydroxymyristoyl] glucosamine N-acyltransferase